MSVAANRTPGQKRLWHRLLRRQTAGMLLRIFLIRHGETEWSRLGRHTGRTDLPLTAHGETEARGLASRLAGIKFDHLFSSPRRRALQTGVLAELRETPIIDDDLREWDYGDFEGLLKDEIVAQHPGWNVYRDGCPGGESAADVVARADRVVARLAPLTGNVAVLSHGHFLRALAVRWVDFPFASAQRLYLNTASISIVSQRSELRDAPTILQWNIVGSLPAA